MISVISTVFTAYIQLVPKPHNDTNQTRKFSKQEDKNTLFPRFCLKITFYQVGKSQFTPLSLPYAHTNMDTYTHRNMLSAQQLRFYQ